jgi:hypothetical protein
VHIDKSSKDISVTCIKSGFQTANMDDDSHAVAATIGNVVAGGLIGLAVDAMSGADYSYVDEIRVALVVSPGGTSEVHGSCALSGEGYPGRTHQFNGGALRRA